MTRKDFELIANVLARISQSELNGITLTQADVVEEFVLALRATNPRFNAARFRDACQEHNAQ